MTITPRDSLPLAGGAVYRTSDICYPIEGLIGVEKIEKRAILSFDTIVNADKFIACISENFASSMKAEDYVKNRRYGWQTRLCRLSPAESYSSPLNIFDFLSQNWEGNSTDKRAGFGNRVYEQEGRYHPPVFSQPSSFQPPQNPFLSTPQCVPVPPETPTSKATSGKSFFSSFSSAQPHTTQTLQSNTGSIRSEQESKKSGDLSSDSMNLDPSESSSGSGDSSEMSHSPKRKIKSKQLAVLLAGWPTYKLFRSRKKQDNH